jgi:hypothetical protein
MRPHALALFAALAFGCPPSSAPYASPDAAPDVPPLPPPKIVDAGALPDASNDESMPPSQADEMTLRMKHLLEAVAHDNPDLGTDVLFPRDAYMAAKDSADPTKAWEKKVQTAFKRGVHSFHKRTKGAEKAQFVSFELGHSVTQITPKRRDWKRALWRVKHSRITFTIDGKTQGLEIGEMTSWRGNWYVTKLR